MPTPFMNRPVLSLAVVAVLGSTAAAQAPGIDPEDAIAPIAVVEGAGVKVGDGTVLHPSIGLEAGVVTNVFYTDQNTVAAGVVRLIGEVGAGSLSPQRLAPTEQTSMDISQPTSAGDFQYRTDLRLSYEYLPSTDDQVSSQGGLGAGFNFRGIINPQRSRQFAVVEDYQRLIRPTNFDSSGNTNRDINDLKLQFQYAPLGRNLSGIIHYEDIVDVFEANTQQFANRFQNTIGLRINYQWLPQTRVYVDATEGIDTGLGDSEKVTSTAHSPRPTDAVVARGRGHGPRRLHERVLQRRPELLIDRRRAVGGLLVQSDLALGGAVPVPPQRLDQRELLSRSPDPGVARACIHALRRHRTGDSELS